MKEIQLTQGQVALVDDEDFEKLNQFDWHVEKQVYTCYASRGRHTYMHHCLIGKPPEGFVTDHFDTNGLNNQKDNLKFITARENVSRRNRKNMSSQYPGVCWSKRHRKWLSRIYINGERLHLGFFFEEENAAKAYKRAYKKIEKLNYKRRLENGDI